MGLFKNLLKHIKDRKKLFVAVMVIGTLMLMAQISQVVFFADDYGLAVGIRKGVLDIIQSSIHHYLTWGGGYTALVVQALLLCGDWAWRVFLVALISIFIALTANMVKTERDNRWLAALLMWAFFFLISVVVTRESIYWLDGGIAYVFSFIQVFLVFYLFYTRLCNGVSKKYDVFLLPFCAFFGGWSSAQSGIAAVLICLVMVLWQKFIAKKRLSKLILTSAILCLVGFLIFYFAPGNNSRMGIGFAEYASLGFFGRIKYRIGNVMGSLFSVEQPGEVVNSFFMYLYMILLSLWSLGSARSAEKYKKIKIAGSIYLLTVSILYLVAKAEIPEISSVISKMFTFTNNFSTSAPKGLLIAALSFGNAFIVTVLSFVLSFIKLKEKKPFVFMISVLMYSVQYCMVMAPYGPLRTTIYAILFAIAACCYMFVDLFEEKQKILPVFMLIFCLIDIRITFFMLLAWYAAKELYAIYGKNKQQNYKIGAIIAVSMLLILSGVNYSKVLFGYYLNKRIDSINVERLEKARDEGIEEGETVYIVPANDPMYGFGGLAGADWIEESVKDYFELPQGVNIKYEGDE